MLDRIEEQGWEQIDNDLFAQGVLSALKRIREIAECDLKTAIDIVHQRFDKLAAECPGRFQCELKTYWNGFYS